MSQQESQPSPFGENGEKGAADSQNPFQIAEEAPSGGSSSPFEAVNTDSPFGIAEPEAGKPAKIPEPRAPGEPPASENPFQLADKKPEAPQGGAAKGGFEMKGFPDEPAPMESLDAAPVAGDVVSSFAPMGGIDIPPARSEGTAFGEPPLPRGDADEEVVRVDPDFGVPMSKATNTPAAESKPDVEDAVFGAAALGAATPETKTSSPAKKAPVTNETKQLALRAIFGVDHELNESEIIQRARTLPGVRNLAKVRPNEMVALETLRNCVAQLGFGDSDSITMSCPGGVIDFVAHGDTSLAIIHEGDYAPGVRETLIIVATEIDNL